jgi:major membrane immunogen (membrane-anchored lipoprotein)
VVAGVHLQSRGDGLMSYAKRIAPLLIAIVAITGLAACGSSDNNRTGTSSNTNTGGKEATTEGGGAESAMTIVVENGEPVGGVQELEYSAGEQISFTVRSDVADEIHVHGYDLMKDVPAGGTVSFYFPADIEGIFEVELEGRKEQIAELRVNP